MLFVCHGSSLSRKGASGKPGAVQGYAEDLDESEVLEIGRDPFLVAHALADQKRRVVVSFEVSKPSKKRKNRKVPDVCKDFGVRCVTLFDVVEELDFTTDWKPPA